MAGVRVGARVGAPLPRRRPARAGTDVPIPDDVLDPLVTAAHQRVGGRVAVQPTGRIVGEIPGGHVVLAAELPPRVVVAGAVLMGGVAGRPVTDLAALGGQRVELAEQVIE